MGVAVEWGEGRPREVIMYVITADSSCWRVETHHCKAIFLQLKNKLKKKKKESVLCSSGDRHKTDHFNKT